MSDREWGYRSPFLGCVVALLRGIEKLRFADKTSVQCAIAEIEEARCDVNADFAERLADSERFDQGRFWKHRRAIEKKWRDPEDVYIALQRREEERRKQRLPPRLGILPPAAVPKEQRARKTNAVRPAVPTSPASNGTKGRKREISGDEHDFAVRPGRLHDIDVRLGSVFQRQFRADHGL